MPRQSTRERLQKKIQERKKEALIEIFDDQIEKLENIKLKQEQAQLEQSQAQFERDFSNVVRKSKTVEEKKALKGLYQNVQKIGPKKCSSFKMK